MRAMMIGDIVGEPGLEILEEELPSLITKHNIDFVTANGENTAGGFGMTEKEFNRIISAGADVVTSGNHVWEKREFWPVLENEKNILRPANFPAAAVLKSCDARWTPKNPGTFEVPGKGFVHIEKNGINWFVVNLHGRELLGAIDCPFKCFDWIIDNFVSALNSPPVILVDFHAESSREKEAFGFYADGRAALIAGTHTHVQTADERILPKGSAFITDIGMTGINESVIGMDPKICIERFRTNIQYQMKIAVNKPAQIQGVIVDIDAETGKAVSIERI